MRLPCGINLHSSLAVTLEGLSLGLTAVKFWNRKAFKGRKAKRKAHNAPIEEKESVRWLENGSRSQWAFYRD